MKLNEIRERFIKFFVNNDHEQVSSSPLIPEHDPTLMFTNAGMVQFKNIFTGAQKTEMKRAVSSQKCLRAGGKRDFRSLWIIRINAAAREHGLTYGRFMHGLTLAGIDLNRKILAEMAVNYKDDFAKLVETVSGKLAESS